MKTLTLYYATNRKHEGKNRWRPDGYGTKFSDDGSENLRFGKLTLQADEGKMTRCLDAPAGRGVGKGDQLGDYLASCAATAKIQSYQEKLRPDYSDAQQPEKRLGSEALFNDLKQQMHQLTDVLIYIHGFNVSWTSAVGSALGLQETLNHSPVRDPKQKVLVVLFTWPSDGVALPFVSYKSDRTDARASGYAVGRGFLKLRDYLAMLRDRSRGGAALCDQDIHLLCHSMGNYVLQNALERMNEFTPGTALPRIFENVFLCAPDVDDNTLEPGEPMGSLHELTRNISIYFNRGDRALTVSDYTKGNPDRLGSAGAARPALLHNKIHEVDCTPIVHGLVEHSYYLVGDVNADIRQSVDGVPQDNPQRKRKRSPTLDRVWVMA